MLVVTNTLIGEPLNWAVAKCMNTNPYVERGKVRLLHLDAEHSSKWKPSTDWAQGGPIIERERIEFRCSGQGMFASYFGSATYWGPTHLIAAMRCYVVSKLGEQVEIPDELMK